MVARCFFGRLAPMLCILAIAGAARADEYVFVDPAVVTDKFETSLRVLKERLDSESPPKWMAAGGRCRVLAHGREDGCLPS